MNSANSKSQRPLILVFVIVNGLFIAGKNWLAKYGINQDVVIIGNLLLFAVMFTSFVITRKSFSSANPQAFVRAVYSGFIVKFFVIAIAAFVYILIAKKEVNKPALITLMILYIVYTFIEVSSLMKLLKEKKHA